MPGADAEDLRPSAETREILGNIQTEIGAGKVLNAINHDERTWNNACDRAIQIIRNYADGYGLFQMVRRAKK